MPRLRTVGGTGFDDQLNNDLLGWTASGKVIFRVLASAVNLISGVEATCVVIVFDHPDGKTPLDPR